MIWFESEGLIIRDLEERDLESIQRYWYDSAPAVLSAMGVEKSRLPARKVRERTFRTLIGTDPSRSDSYLLFGEADGRPVGYCLFNYIDRQEQCCEVHIHIFDERDRRRGFVSSTFGPVLTVASRVLGVNQFLFEPSVANAPVNAFLRKKGLEPELTYLKAGRGICREMKVHRYRFQISTPVEKASGSLSS